MLNWAANGELFYGVTETVKFTWFFVVLEILKRICNRTPKFIDELKQIFSAIYPLAIILPGIFGLDYVTYADSNSGQLGVMYSVNAFSFVMIIVFYWSVEYLVNRVTVWNIIRAGYCCVSLLRIGSKSVYLFGAMIGVYFAVVGLKKKTINNVLKTVLMIGAAGVGIFIIIRIYSAEMQNILARWTYYFFKSEKMNFTNLMIFMTSGRWSRISAYYSIWTEKKYSILIGLGFAFFKNNVTVEMDMITLLYLFGIVGFFLYIKTFWNVAGTIIKNLKFRFLPVMAFCYLFFGGHVLNDPMASTLLALVLVSSQNICWNGQSKVSVSQKEREDA
jgi:hypothetical protein